MPASYLPGACCRIRSGRYAGRTGTVTQPPQKSWPDAAGCIGVLLNKTPAKPAETRLFTPSQLELI